MQIVTGIFSVSTQHGVVIQKQLIQQIEIHTRNILKKQFYSDNPWSNADFQSSQDLKDFNNVRSYSKPIFSYVTRISFRHIIEKIIVESSERNDFVVEAWIKIIRKFFEGLIHKCASHGILREHILEYLTIDMRGHDANSTTYYIIVGKRFCNAPAIAEMSFNLLEKFAWLKADTSNKNKNKCRSESA